jgi:transposase InsO family protein
MGETLQVSAASLPLATGGGGALVDEVTMQFPKLTDAAQGTYPAFQHTITLSNDAKPHVTKPRTIPFARREAVAAECQRMMDDGIWSPIDKSEWVHALVTVPKSDGTVRITTDLSPLNKYVVPERHQLPNIQELFLKLSGMKYYTKLDLKKGYYHIKLAENSQPLTATMTPIGLMAYNRLPMGLKDAASVFQKAVSRVLTTCNNCIAFIDDILIYAATRAEHDRALTKVLRQLHDNDFRLNVPKCSFAQQEIQFLGHIVSAGGIKADPKNTAAIANTPQPTTLKQLQSFLGAVNYYSQHVPNLATIAEPLRKLTRNDQRFIFDDECIAAFNEIKAAVASGLRLAIYSFDAETTVTVDSSDYGLGAVLSQKQNGVEVPIAFASRTMSPAERNYATNEREALSALWACEHWEKFLLGRHFTLKTDHASLTALLTKHTSKRKSAKFTRWLERLSQFDYDIVHIKGTNNVMADFLSRLPLDNEQPRVSSNDGDDDDNELSIKALTTTTDISVPQLQQETERDDTLKTVYKYVHSTWPEKKAIAPALMPYYTLRDELYSANRMLMRDGRIVVPTSRQQSLLQRAHEGHPGIVRMKRQLRQSYWWPGLDTQAEAFVKNCIACNDSAKAHKQCKPPVQAIPVPSKPWSKVAIDVTGPFANAPHHQRFIVVLIDYMSSFPEVLLTGEVTSTKIITWLRQVFARFGNPDILVSDNGTNFTSDEFRNFLQSRDIIHHPVPVYNPERNGKVEAFNKYLKQGVQTFQASHTPFHNGIDELLFNYRATAPTAHDESPAKRLFGYEIRQNFQPNNHSLIQPIREVAQDDAPQQEQSKAGALPQFTGPYKTGDLVRKRKIHVPKGTSPFTSPFKVTAALGNYTYKLDDGQIWNAKNLVKYVPKQRQYVEMAVDEQPAAAAAPQPQQPRRSSRHNKGVLPRRFRE